MDLRDQDDHVYSRTAYREQPGRVHTVIDHVTQADPHRRRRSHERVRLVHFDEDPSLMPSRPRQQPFYVPKPARVWSWGSSRQKLHRQDAEAKQLIPRERTLARHHRGRPRPYLRIGPGPTRKTTRDTDSFSISFSAQDESDQDERDSDGSGLEDWAAEEWAPEDSEQEVYWNPRQQEFARLRRVHDSGAQERPKREAEVLGKRADVTYDPSRAAARDMAVRVEMDIEEDLESELEEFSRLRRLGRFKEAKAHVMSRLDRLGPTPYSQMLYADMLLAAGDYRTFHSLPSAVPLGSPRERHEMSHDELSRYLVDANYGLLDVFSQRSDPMDVMWAEILVFETLTTLSDGPIVCSTEVRSSSLLLDHSI